MPSYNDYPNANSLPHPPLSVMNLFGESQLPQNVHSMSNPCRMSVMGQKMVVSRNDLAKEVRKNHLSHLSEVSEKIGEQVCETIWSQQYLGAYEGGRVAYKWNYNKSLWLNEECRNVVVGDSSAPQFVYHTQVSRVQFVNPGNFAEKGEFVMLNVTPQGVAGSKCKL